TPTQTTFIQELNYIGDKIGRLAVSGGAFYMSSQDGYPHVHGGDFYVYFPVTLLPAAPGDAVFDQPFAGRLEKQIGAAWVEGSFDLMSNLIITVGGRYSYERQEAYSAFTVDGTRPPLTEFPGGPQVFTRFTPHATLSYRLDDNQSVYASYSKGFKS